MVSVQSNYPLVDIFAFRESGYINELVNILQHKAGSNIEVYIYFKLSKWKGEDLVVPVNSKKKVVLCVGDESTDVAYSFTDQVDIIFRTYLLNDLGVDSKLHHLPVGHSAHFAAGEGNDFASRKYNVFFSGNLHLGRANLYRALTKAWPVPFFALHRLKTILGENFDKLYPNSIIRFSTGFHNGISPREYAQIMQDSKICLCPGGVESPETMRHFEAARLGNIVISEPLPQTRVYNKAPFVILASWRELHKTIKQLLAEPTRMLDLHYQTLEWWRTMASPEAVVASMYETMQRKNIVS